MRASNDMHQVSRALIHGAILLGLAANAAAPAQAAELAGKDASKEAAQEAGPQLSGYAKAMYIGDDKKGGRPNQSSFGLGGKLGAETAAYRGVKLKGAWYATTDLGLRQSDPRKTDAYLFDLDKTPYSLLGEIQISAQWGNTALTLGRQAFFSPLINTYDYRIIPNLFEAFTLINRDLPETRLTLAYVSKMSGLDGLVSFSQFRSMAQQAYTSLKLAADGSLDASNGETLDISRVVGERGVWVAGIAHGQDNKFQLWNYYGTDTLNTLYLDAQVAIGLDQDFSAKLEAQAYQVNAVGGFKAYLSRLGLNADYALYGLKGSLIQRSSGLTLSLAHNHFTGNQQTVTAYGNWGGYPEFVLMPYLYAENKGSSAIAGSDLSRLSLLIDLGVYGWAGQSILLGQSKINIAETILANSDITVKTLLYRAQINPKLSARVSMDARHSKNSRYDNEFVTLALRYDF